MQRLGAPKATMCGISGFINFNGHHREKARSLLKRMTDSLVHRGPDAEGYYVDDHAALGHRRLSIIDITGGAQPMTTSDKWAQIVYNGEVYNFQQLREELKALGHTFHTRSDTEVILLGYRQWGSGVVNKLDGMFAFAIWNPEQRVLFLARDRVGKKPLYYSWDGNTFCFASELKALLAGRFFPKEIDPEALDCYFTFGYIPSPKTIFKAAHKLCPGHMLEVTPGGLKKQRYWSLGFSEPENWNENTMLEEFEDLLDHAVKQRLIAEVPLGAFLSGGLDSTLVVSSMARVAQGPVLTNSIGFGVKQYDELPVARRVAQHLGTDHHEFIVQPDIREVLEKIAWHFDEPFADSSAVPTWYVCRMARQNVTVSLSGDGGDENFGGYTFRYIPHMWESRVRDMLPVPIRTLLFGILGSLYPSSARLPRRLRLKTILENLAVSDSEAFYRDLAFLRPSDRERLYDHDFQESLKGFNPIEAVRPLYMDDSAPDALRRAQQADIFFYMTHDVLVKVDRMSMAHSLEVRCPLLDHHVMEFAARVPRALKINNRHGKVLLRKVAEKRLPRVVLEQPKKGFSIPAAEWLRGELKPMAQDIIFRRGSLISDVFRRHELRRIWKEHQSGTRDHSVFLWGLIMLGLWQQNYYDSPTPRVNE